MRRYINHLLLLAATLLLTTSQLWAEEPAPEEPPWYEFELIIFANQRAAQIDNELWTTDPGRPSSLNTVPLRYKTWFEREEEEAYFEMSQRPEAPAHIESADDPAPLEEEMLESKQPVTLVDSDSEESSEVDVVELPIPYQQLPDSLLELSESYNKLLKTRGAIEPLVHMAWRQQVQPPELAETLYLTLATDEAEQTPGLPDQTELPQLEGSIKISVKRYLHVDIDLVLRKLASPSSNSDDNRAFTTLSPYYQGYRMQVHRRMRSQELHYIDHPLMGVLIIARRYELPVIEEVIEDENTISETLSEADIHTTTAPIDN